MAYKLNIKALQNYVKKEFQDRVVKPAIKKSCKTCGGGKRK